MKNKEDLFILVGPTAIGKSSLSVDLAHQMNGEIISADSMQIYKLMNIGTAKISIDEMDNIPHYLLDLVYPDEEFTVANFREKAKELITSINQEGKLPMIVGGTGLYINSLIYDLKFTKVEPNFEIRKRLESLGEENGNEYLHDMLRELDQLSADRINVNDRKRIIRAIEIFKVTGKRMSEHNKNFRKPIESYNLTMIGLKMDRWALYNRINERVDIMIKSGLVEEVEGLLSMGYDKGLVSMQGIGYKEIIMYLEGTLSLEESIELIKKGTRNYAKRQLTWFRREDRINWVNIDDFNNEEEIKNHILDIVSNNNFYR